MLKKKKRLTYKAESLVGLLSFASQSGACCPCWRIRAWLHWNSVVCLLLLWDSLWGADTKEERKKKKEKKEGGAKKKVLENKTNKKTVLKVFCNLTCSTYTYNATTTTNTFIKHNSNKRKKKHSWFWRVDGVHFLLVISSPPLSESPAHAAQQGVSTGPGCLGLVTLVPLHEHAVDKKVLHIFLRLGKEEGVNITRFNPGKNLCSDWVIDVQEHRRRIFEEDALDGLCVWQIIRPRLPVPLHLNVEQQTLDCPFLDTETWESRKKKKEE